MPIFISIVILLLTLQLFSNNLSVTIKTSNWSPETQNRMPMIRGDETVDPNMPMFPKSDFIAVDKQPIPIKQVKPLLPHLDGRRLLGATVWVKVLVDVEGKVKKAEILKSHAVIFNEATLNAARQWVFKPAMKKNKPVEVWVAIPFRIKLH